MLNGAQRLSPIQPEITPIQPALRGFATKLRHPSPILGEGLGSAWPSPLMGEGYGGLAASLPSRSWMGVIFEVRRALTPIQPALGSCAAKLRHPSPIEGEGESCKQVDRVDTVSSCFRALKRF